MKKQNSVQSEQEKSIKEIKKDFPTWPFLLILAFVPCIMYWQIFFDGKFLWDDFRYLFYPQHEFAVRELLRGIFPFWNPYSYGGIPFLGDIQTALFYPINALYLLMSPGGILSPWWCQVIVAMHLAIAGIGQFYLVKHFVKSKWIAFFCALFFMMSAQMALRIVQPVVLNAMVWVPAIFYLTIKAVESRDLRFAAGAALALGLGLLAGYPQFILIGMLCLGAIIIFQIAYQFTKDSKETRVKIATHRTLIFGVLVVLGFALSSIQVMPAVEFSKHATRENWTYEMACENSFRPERFVTAFMPNFFGKIIADPPQGFWLNDGSWSYWEQGIFFGTAAVALLIIGLPFVVRQGWPLFTFIMSLLILWTSLGKFGGIYYLVYSLVPFFDKMRGPSKFIFPFCILISLFIGFVLKRLSDLNELPKKVINRQLIFAGIVTGVVAIIAYGMLQSGLIQFTGGELDYFKNLANNSLLMFIFSMILAVGLIALFLYKKLSFTLTILFLSIFSICEYLIHYGDFPGSKYNPLELHSPRLVPPALIPSSPNDLFRVNTRYYGDSKYPGTLLLQRNQGCFVDIHQMEGLAPLTLNRMFFPTLDIMKKLTPERGWGLLNVRYMAAVDEVQQSYTLKQLDHTPRAFFVTEYEVSSSDEQTINMLARPEFNMHRTVVLEKKLSWQSHEARAQSNISIEQYRSDKIAIKATVRDTGVLVVTEYTYPDWKAYVNGKRADILQANYNVRALSLNPGEYTIEFKYESESFKRGLVIFLLALMAICGILIIGFLRVKNRAKERT